MKSEARFLRFERRISRSPRISCSATTTIFFGLEAGSERQHGERRLPRLELFRLRQRRDLL
jgi:hypothetical protein